MSAKIIRDPLYNYIGIDSKRDGCSSCLTRLKPVTEAPAEMVRYYLPKDLQKEAQRLRADWK